MRRTMIGAEFSKFTEGVAGKTGHIRLSFLIACIFALFLCPAMYGQATGSFSGNVLDKSGSSVVGATVTATSQGTGLARDVKTIAPATT